VRHHSKFDVGLDSTDITEGHLTDIAELLSSPIDLLVSAHMWWEIQLASAADASGTLTQIHLNRVAHSPHSAILRCTALPYSALGRRLRVPGPGLGLTCLGQHYSEGGDRSGDWSGG
jgi:hypothetical protein